MIKFIKYKKVKAGALQYVLTISVIIAVILLAFILLINLQTQLTTKTNLYKQTIYNVNAGFNFIKHTNIDYNEKINRQFSDNSKEETTIIKKRWGVFDIITIKSKIGNQFFEGTALVGEKKTKKTALYLQDNNTPLVLVGNSHIIGNSYLPIQGVKTGNIGGTSFYGNFLIIGKKNNSSKNLPEIKKIKSIETFTRYSYLEDEYEVLELEEGINKSQSFNEPILIYQSNSNIDLKRIKLKGNIIVKSHTKIRITNSAQLNDIILIAPEIEILENVKGNFQAFTSKSLKINKGVTLSYPSVLSLLPKEDDLNTEQNNSLIIEDNSSVKGIVIYSQKKSDEKPNYNSPVIIKENSVLTGELYCDGNLELLGKIDGTVITKNFITKQYGSTYINHIYNGQINSKNLPEQYVGILSDSFNKDIVKWMY